MALQVAPFSQAGNRDSQNKISKLKQEIPMKTHFRISVIRKTIKRNNRRNYIEHPTFVFASFTGAGALTGTGAGAGSSSDSSSPDEDSSSPLLSPSSSELSSEKLALSVSKTSNSNIHSHNTRMSNHTRHFSTSGCRCGTDQQFLLCTTRIQKQNPKLRKSCRASVSGQECQTKHPIFPPLGMSLWSQTQQFFLCTNRKTIGRCSKSCTTPRTVPQDPSAKNGTKPSDKPTFFLALFVFNVTVLLSLLVRLFAFILFLVRVELFFLKNERDQLHYSFLHLR